MFPVSVARRIELCAKFNYTCQWEEVGSSRTGETTMELDSPRKKEPIGKLAEVGGECFFSSIYYLLVGRKSGKRISHRVKKTKSFCFILSFIQKVKATNMNVCVDRHSTNETKKCRAIWIAAMDVAKDAAFKKFCKETLGTAISDFMAQECAKATVAVTEHGVRENMVKMKSSRVHIDEMCKYCNIFTVAGHSNTPAD